MSAPSGDRRLFARRAANARNLGGLALRAMYRIRVIGLEHLPVAGPVLIVGHCPEILAGAVIKAMACRPVHVIGGDAVQMALPARGLRLIGDIPRVGAGIGAARMAQALLMEGGAVAVLGSSPPVGYLVAISNAPVVPVVVIGAAGRVPTDPPAPGTRIDVVFSPASLIPTSGDPCAERVVLDAGERVRQIVADAHLRARPRRPGG
ncbi:MAG: hypothetical protein F2793_07210 [Actinobacteria bacterium]|uniref:Unannotated protein n=1 Tax=freshwater metagenome TaxID=449393 RepID=A0A6J7EJR3_9ZZZZ|nr:hypothetical protein [Actinomycetota bacterium]